MRRSRNRSHHARAAARAAVPLSDRAEWRVAGDGAVGTRDRADDRLRSRTGGDQRDGGADLRAGRAECGAGRRGDRAGLHVHGDGARIYHDAGITFRSELKDSPVQPFAGVNYRMEEIRAAMLRVQLTRLDGILTALRTRYRRLRELLNGALEFAPIHDLDGICA